MTHKIPQDSTTRQRLLTFLFNVDRFRYNLSWILLLCTKLRNLFWKGNTSSVEDTFLTGKVSYTSHTKTYTRWVMARSNYIINM